MATGWIQEKYRDSLKLSPNNFEGGDISSRWINEEGIALLKSDSHDNNDNFSTQLPSTQSNTAGPGPGITDLSPISVQYSESALKTLQSTANSWVIVKLIYGNSKVCTKDFDQISELFNKCSSPACTPPTSLQSVESRKSGLSIKSWLSIDPWDISNIDLEPRYNPAIGIRKEASEYFLCKDTEDAAEYNFEI